jgi:hypothetical protein
MATTPTYINQRINNLQAQINSIISGGGGGVPTSSDLADVLVNGNSAGTTDIDMNSQDITNVDTITFLNSTTTNVYSVGVNGNDFEIASSGDRMLLNSGVVESYWGDYSGGLNANIGLNIGGAIRCDIDTKSDGIFSAGDINAVGANTTIALNDNVGSISLISNSGTIALGDVNNTLGNNCKIEVLSTNDTIGLNGYNVNSYGFAMPICFTRERTADNFTYNLGGQAWENVYTVNFAVPYEFFCQNPSAGYTSSKWKIEFALNCFQFSNPTDKGIGLYIEFQDPASSIYTPNTFNQSTPFSYDKRFGYSSGGNQPYMPFIWTDWVDFSGLVNTGSGNVPLNMLLWFAADAGLTTQFNLSVTLTRTNLV